MVLNRALTLMLAWIAVISASVAHAQNFPKLSGRVVDAANIIPADQEAALTAKLAGIETQSGRQFVVATIPDLQGYPISDYGYQLGRFWAIGQKKENNGLLLVVAPNDRKVRVEVGYGLEPIVTDVFSGRVIREKILPAFKAGDLPGGINAGVDALAEQILLPPEEAATRAQAMAAEEQSAGGDAGAVIFWLFIFFFFILPMIWPLFFGRTRGRRHGSGPVVIWGGGNDWGGSSGSSWGGGSFGGGGGFSGGGGSFGGGGSSGSW